MNENQIVDVLIGLFDAYGYFVVFAILLFENLFLLGLIIPGETVLLLGAAFAAQGSLNIVYVIIAAIVAATIGNIAGYFIGKKGGRPLLEKFGSKFEGTFWGRFVSVEQIKSAEKYFDEHGPKTVFVGRFAAGVRTFVPLLAGAAKMSFSKFLAYTVAAIVTWTVGLGTVGFYFGQQWSFIKMIFERFTFLILVVVIIFIVLYIIRRKRAEVLNGDSNS